MTGKIPNTFQAGNSRAGYGFAQFAKFNNIRRLAIAIPFLIFSAALFSPGAAIAADGSGTLSIQASGFLHERGHAIANLFREGDEVLNLNNVYRRAKVEIHDGKASIEFADLAYGTYAVSVYHDENDNGILEHNMFHFPAEPLGFSNHFQLGLTSGMPTFEKMKFPFAADTGVLEIVVK